VLIDLKPVNLNWFQDSFQSLLLALFKFEGDAHPETSSSFNAETDGSSVPIKLQYYCGLQQLSDEYRNVKNFLRDKEEEAK